MAKLGIDLGTTRSAVGKLSAGDPELLANKAGDRLTPSVVYYGDDETLVGKPAQNKLKLEPDKVITEIKREMGTDHTVEIGDSEYTPVDVSAEIIEKLVQNTEEVDAEEVEEILITVPAFFTIHQKQATREAAVAAGFDEEDIELLREPTAAAIAYGYGSDKDETVLVYDFGGGTLDISVMDIEGPEFSIRATKGDTELGGADFTEALLDLLADEYEQEHGVDLRANSETRSNLWQVAEEKKIALSANGREKTEVNAPLLGQVDGDVAGITERVLTQDEFEETVDHLVDQAMEPLDEALGQANMTTDDIDTVLLVGGSSKIPIIQNRIEQYFGFPPDKTNDLDRIVAYGAAIMVDSDGGGGPTQYVCPTCDEPFDLVSNWFEHIVEEHGAEDCPFPDCSVEISGPSELVEHVQDRHDLDIETDDNGGDGPGVKNLAERTYGTDVEGGKMDTLIEEGTKLPTSFQRTYTTTYDGQKEVSVDIYTGESDYLKDNTRLHPLKLTEIPPMDEGEPRIEVEFMMDDNGLLEVTAEEIETGTRLEANINPGGKTSVDDDKTPADND